MLRLDVWGNVASVIAFLGERFLKRHGGKLGFPTQTPHRLSPLDPHLLLLGGDAAYGIKESGLLPVSHFLTLKEPKPSS